MLFHHTGSYKVLTIFVHEVNGQETITINYTQSQIDQNSLHFNLLF